jgi:bacterioferritin
MSMRDCIEGARFKRPPFVLTDRFWGHFLHFCPRMTNQTPKNIQEIKSSASSNILRGAVTDTYQGDQNEVIRLLNEALATELTCSLRYRHDFFTSDGILSESIKQEFLEHAKEEAEHADQISERIRQLGGNPEMAPEKIAKLTHVEFSSGDTLVDKIRDNLIAERIAIDSYRAIIDYVRPFDSTTRRLMESVLAKEEEHADDLATLLVTLDPSQKAKQAA